MKAKMGGSHPHQIVTKGYRVIHLELISSYQIPSDPIPSHHRTATCPIRD